MDTKKEKQPVVLVVDDDELAGKAVVQLLSRRGFTMLTAQDGREALRMLGQQPVDVLVLDVMMPEMTGLELARALTYLRPEMPVIMMSGHVKAEDRRRAFTLGVREYLQKPIPERTLEAALERILDRR